MTLLGDVSKLRGDYDRLAIQVEESVKVVSKHEEQISGERGIYSAIRELAETVRVGQDKFTEDVSDLRRTMRNVGVAVVGASLTFSISVLVVFG